jgi:hypothetical protein
MSPITPNPIGLPPSIAVKLAINPPSFRMSDRVRLHITAISNASEPITIYTWPNIFNPGLSQMRGSLVVSDKDTHEKLQLPTVDIERGLTNFTLGGPEDGAFVTLEPGRPTAFEGVSFAYGSETLPGHRYLIDLQEGENVGWWKEGRKEDVLDLPGKDRGAQYPDGKPIVLSLEEPVEFKFLPLDS